MALLVDIRAPITFFFFFVVVVVVATHPSRSVWSRTVPVPISKPIVLLPSFIYLYKSNCTQKFVVFSRDIRTHTPHNMHDEHDLNVHVISQMSAENMEFSKPIDIELTVHGDGCCDRRKILGVPLTFAMRLKVVKSRLTKASSALSAARNIPTKIFLRVKAIHATLAAAFLCLVLEEVVPSPVNTQDVFRLVCHHCTHEYSDTCAASLLSHLSVYGAIPTTGNEGDVDSVDIAECRGMLERARHNSLSQPFGNIIEMNFAFGHDAPLLRSSRPSPMTPGETQSLDSVEDDPNKYLAFPSNVESDDIKQTGDNEQWQGDNRGTLHATIVYKKLPVIHGTLTKNQQDAYDELYALIGGNCPAHVDSFMEFVLNTREEVSGRTLDAVNASLGSTLYSYYIVAVDLGCTPSPCCGKQPSAEFKMTMTASHPGAFLFVLNESYYGRFATYTKSLFDCFGRGPVVELIGSNGPTHIALSQLVYFYWLRQYDVISFVRKTLDSVLLPTQQLSVNADHPESHGTPPSQRTLGAKRKSTKETRMRLVKRKTNPEMLSFSAVEYHYLFGLPAEVP